MTLPTRNEIKGIIAALIIVVAVCAFARVCQDRGAEQDKWLYPTEEGVDLGSPIVDGRLYMDESGNIFLGESDEDSSETLDIYIGDSGTTIPIAEWEWDGEWDNDTTTGTFLDMYTKPAVDILEFSYRAEESVEWDTEIYHIGIPDDTLSTLTLYAGSIPALTTASIRLIGESGRVCAVFGHSWHDEDAIWSAGNWYSIPRKEIIGWERECKVCGHTQTKMFKTKWEDGP